jgi:tetratricopeptide (TPR) repeat protein
MIFGSQWVATLENVPILINPDWIPCKSLICVDLFQVIESARQVLKEYDDSHERRRWEIIMGAAESMPTRFSVYETIRFGVAGPSLEHIWSLLEREGSFYEVDFWGIRMAYAYGSFVDVEAGIRYLQEAIPKLQDTNRSWELATALLCLARLQIQRLSYNAETDAESERYIRDALNIFTALGDELNVSYALLQLGHLRLKQERLEEAIEQWKSAQAALNNLDEWSVANNIIRLMGDAYLQLGQFKQVLNVSTTLPRSVLNTGMCNRQLVPSPRKALKWCVTENWKMHAASVSNVLS